MLDFDIQTCIKNQNLRIPENSLPISNHYVLVFSLHSPIFFPPKIHSVFTRIQNLIDFCYFLKLMIRVILLSNCEFYGLGYFYGVLSQMRV